MYPFPDLLSDYRSCLPHAAASALFSLSKLTPSGGGSNCDSGSSSRSSLAEENENSHNRAFSVGSLPEWVCRRAVEIIAEIAIMKK